MALGSGADAPGCLPALPARLPACLPACPSIPCCLSRRYAGRKVMLGVDRLDMIKGIPQVRTALYCLCAAAVLRWVTLHVLLHACLAPRPAPGLPADTFFLHCFPMPHFLPLFVASLLSSLPLSAARCASLW